MTFQQRMAEKLGLAGTASEDDILAALQPKSQETAALQSQLPELAAALGLDKGSDLTTVLAAAKTAGQDAKTTLPALQAQVTALSTELKGLQDKGTKAIAEAFFDTELKAGRMGLNAQNREEFVAMHMENPARTEKLVQGFAVMKGRPPAADPGPGGSIALNAEDIVGKAKALQSSEQAKGNSLSWTDAVLKVSEGKA